MRRHLRRALPVLKIVGFLGFTTYVLDVATSASGPAIDIAFDIAVYVALVVHIARRWLDRWAAAVAQLLGGAALRSNAQPRLGSKPATSTN